MKKIIYVVRTDMPLLKIMGLFGCINWKVALRKEITALFVLEVCFFIIHIIYWNMSYCIQLSVVRVLSSQGGPWHTWSEVFTMQKFHKNVVDQVVQYKWNEVQQTEVNVHI